MPDPRDIITYSSLRAELEHLTEVKARAAGEVKRDSVSLVLTGAVVAMATVVVWGALSSDSPQTLLQLFVAGAASAYGFVRFGSAQREYSDLAASKERLRATERAIESARAEIDRLPVRLDSEPEEERREEELPAEELPDARMDLSYVQRTLDLARKAEAWRMAFVRGQIQISRQDAAHLLQELTAQQNATDHHRMVVSQQIQLLAAVLEPEKLEVPESEEVG